MRTIEYELTLSYGDVETKQVACEILADNILIDGIVHISGGGSSGSWGGISGDIERQLDLMQKFHVVEQDISDEATARADADTELGNKKADKVKNASDGDFASLDENGNLEDSEVSVTSVTGHMSNKSNPHEVTKSQVGLGNVDNTSDLDKPVSTATTTELAKKADKVATATDGDIVQFDENGNIEDSGVSASGVSTHLSNTNNPHVVTKAQVGLGNVDNTSDLDKPISTATQTALNAKADKVPSANDGDLVQFDENGNIEDSGIQATRITGIESKIPSQASASNQLADKDFVNSTAETFTATPRGTYNEVSDLLLTTSASRSDIALALDNIILVADKNDYCYVEIPIADSMPTVILRYEKYKHNGTGWTYEYIVPNSGFTSAQWASINSGVTETKRQGYDSHIDNSDIHVTSSNKNAWNNKYDKPSTGIPKTDLASSVLDDVVRHDSDLPASAVPINADQLNGVADTGYVKKYATSSSDWDTTPTAGSNKPVTSGGVASLITQNITNGDTTHAPSSDAVNDAINAIKTSVGVGITINDSDFTLVRNDSRYYPTLRLLVVDVQLNSSNISVSRKSSPFTIILPTGVSTLSGTRILSSVANEQVDSYLNANLGAYATSEGNVTIDKPSYVTRYAQPRFNAVWYV